jgi:hypothetical protein
VHIKLDLVFELDPKIFEFEKIVKIIVTCLEIKKTKLKLALRKPIQNFLNVRIRTTPIT